MTQRGKLNKKTEITKKIIHIMVTSLCSRNCKHCCNKQYNLHDIPYVTDEELKEAETLCLTGGEPFAFTNPCEIANYYKHKYKNVKNIYVYTNAVELAKYLHCNTIRDIDGISISIKTKADALAFDGIKDRKDICQLASNRLYVFDNLYTEETQGFDIIHREWMEDFQPANDSIFRRV
jgi:molybdenum cofactor biosynthesis enzyme MoaA